MVSRNNNVFKNFAILCASIGKQLRVQNAILDGEICCLNSQGHSVFNDLMFRRAEPFFYSFDLLWLNGEDLRMLPLVERKKRLRKIIPKSGSHVLFLDHIENDGVKLFECACQLDLEGIVAKRKSSAYRATEQGSPYWIKIKNPHYSQVEGRDELFERQATP